MSNRYMQQFFGSNTHGLVSLHGSVAIGADAAVGASTIKGVTVTKTGTGEYTLTLDDSYHQLLFAGFKIKAATAVDLIPQIKSDDVVTAKTIVVNLLATATPTNPSAALVLEFSSMLRNSSVLY